MLARFGAEVRASLGNGTLECAERDAGGEAAERAREAAELAAGLAARRDELAARLARFRQVRQMMATGCLSLGSACSWDANIRVCFVWRQRAGMLWATGCPSACSTSPGVCTAIE